MMHRNCFCCFDPWMELLRFICSGIFLSWILPDVTLFTWKCLSFLETDLHRIRTSFLPCQFSWYVNAEWTSECVSEIHTVWVMTWCMFSNKSNYDSNYSYVWLWPHGNLMVSYGKWLTTFRNSRRKFGVRNAHQLCTQWRRHNGKIRVSFRLDLFRIRFVS